ncbi:hypothetical protein Cgig2_008107 [Carnegiea gigantea]|uniref:Uncharacterized protein n=1 Tax=Carnegiea gigantea TaxID=171969 RepID=A0A9Q1QRY6_9CARY|nr:hypothetical protein Cgig2_008107 [Carnegiea gigantea]
MPSFSTVRASSDKLETPPITVGDEVGESLQIGDIEESPDEGLQSKSSSFSASTGASPLIAKELKKASFCLLISMMPNLLKSVLGELYFLFRISTHVVNKTAATFAPRASTATKNPAVPGTALYTIFEVQGYASMRVWYSILEHLMLSCVPSLLKCVEGFSASLGD